jgi:hypothetical protein
MLLVSCGSTPEALPAGRPELRGTEEEEAAGERSAEVAVDEREATPAADPVAGTEPSPRDPAGSEGPIRPQKDGLLYNLATDLNGRPPAGENGADGKSAARASRHEAGEAEVVRLPPLADGVGGLGAYSEESLLTELDARFSAEWTALSGGIGNPGADVADPRRDEAARRLIALAAIRPPEEPGPLTEALAYSMSDRRKMEHKLLAAAYLEMQGRGDEARRLVASVAGGAPGALPVGPTPGAFHIAGLAFARTIDGPGKFTAAPPSQVAPGKTVLIYGEFRGFHNLLQEAEGGKEPVHRCAFAGSLRLISPAEEEIDRLEFLPEGRGLQEAPAAKEIVNFWARYRIPPNLKPGKHRIVVEGRDILAGSTASAEIEFDV